MEQKETLSHEKADLRKQVEIAAGKVTYLENKCQKLLQEQAIAKADKEEAEHRARTLDVEAKSAKKSLREARMTEPVLASHAGETSLLRSPRRVRG